jgi:(1->4)-alpha-D-glucan 1-alpha-D-glucosylmutase
MTVRATLRLQFHAGFRFADALRQLSYFEALGVSHLYASPILRARAGSLHGYDVVDPTQVNPELGGEDGLRELVAGLRARGMGLIVDIVPNHMAVGEADNPWWQDVLENGPHSSYAGFFDIDWDSSDPLLRGRVLAPFLGKPYGEALAAGEIALCFEQERFQFACYSHRFPLAPRDYAPLLKQAGLPEAADLFQAGRDFAAARRELAAIFETRPEALGRILEAQADPRWLHRLLERQHYRLSWWRCAGDEINWRRFFDISQLAGLRIQDPVVFEAVHATIFRLYAEGLLDGLRIDHVDGLADPRAYCRRLRARLAELAAGRPGELAQERAYIVVEKILGPGEKLARDWQVDGSSGYAFMNDVGALLHDPAGDAPLGELWRELSGRGSYEAEEARARRSIPQELFSADFNACAHALHRIARSEPGTRDWTLTAIRRVLSELLVHFPVYRTYADGRGRSPADAAIMRAVVGAAMPKLSPSDRPLLELMDRWLGGEPPRQLRAASARRLRLRAIARFQQLTAPVAAKAVEDTVFYRHGRLLSRNEVGADPSRFALDAAAFHRLSRERHRRYPLTMLATATHDHKRGEDLRARLAVLSELPQRWAEVVRSWRAANAARHGSTGPDAADELMLYQTLAGAWPLDLAADDREGLAAFEERVAGWQLKALREAKRHSSWLEPDLAYEGNCRGFLQRLMGDAGFVSSLHGLVEDIAAAGAVNGLSQALLRMTSPGMPDLYQGTEYWDFSLVDPDNRRPVDFDGRAHALQAATALPELLRHWRDGRIKQRLVRAALGLRKRQPSLFAVGDYLPLAIRGRHSGRLLAFARRFGDQAALVAVPLRSLPLLPDPRQPDLRRADWADTAIRVPPDLRRPAQDLLGEASAQPLDEWLPATRLFANVPVALLAL